MSSSIKDAGNFKPAPSSAHVLKEDVDKMLQVLKKDYSNQQGEINDLRFIVRIFSDRFSTMQNKWAQECPPKVAEHLEEVLPDVVDSDLSRDLREMRHELHNFKSSKRMVKFQELALHNLHEMHAWLV